LSLYDFEFQALYFVVIEVIERHDGGEIFRCGRLLLWDELGWIVCNEWLVECSKVCGDVERAFKIAAFPPSPVARG
jgi:hypothetical protein